MSELETAKNGTTSHNLIWPSPTRHRVPEPQPPANMAPKPKMKPPTTPPQPKVPRT